MACATPQEIADDLQAWAMGQGQRAEGATGSKGSKVSTGQQVSRVMTAIRSMAMTVLCEGPTSAMGRCPAAISEATPTGPLRSQGKALDAPAARAPRIRAAAMQPGDGEGHS